MLSSLRMDGTIHGGGDPRLWKSHIPGTQIWVSRPSCALPMSEISNTATRLLGTLTARSLGTVMWANDWT
jgi:hypothetical protein